VQRTTGGPGALIDAFDLWANLRICVVFYCVLCMYTTVDNILQVYSILLIAGLRTVADPPSLASGILLEDDRALSCRCVLEGGATER